MSVQEAAPIFVIGRQHSGNTMLVQILGRIPSVLSMIGEGQFFEYLASSQLDKLELNERVRHVVRLISTSSWPRLTPEVRGALSEAMLREVQRGQGEIDSSAIALYARGMDHLSRRHGKTRWAQKATSHIFYVESIVEGFPRARLVYLARNPLDLAASLKRRGRQSQYMRMVWGWNKGMRLARRHQERYPANFLLVRYEDLVRQPEVTVRKICDFARLRFVRRCLQVPHVNRSETPYNRTSEVLGIDSSRVFYYQSVLTPTEEMTIRAGTNRFLLERAYPDLPCSVSRVSLRTLCNLIRLMLLGTGSLLKHHRANLMARPRYVADRIWHRLR